MRNLAHPLQRLEGWYSLRSLHIHIIKITMLTLIRYRITKFFTGSYFCILEFILVREVIFVEEKFAYRRSIKKITTPGEVLFSAQLSGARAAVKKQLCVLRKYNK